MGDLSTQSKDNGGEASNFARPSSSHTVTSYERQTEPLGEKCNTAIVSVRCVYVSLANNAGNVKHSAIALLHSIVSSHASSPAQCELVLPLAIYSIPSSP